MTTATIRKIVKEEVEKARAELRKEFLVINKLTYGKDPEGEYRPEFVERVLKAAKEKPKYNYDSKTFLKLIS